MHRNNNYIDGLGSNPEATNYYFKALEQLSKRLGDPRDCTKYRSHHYNHWAHVGDWQRWSLHLAGLDRVLKLRTNACELDDHIQVLTFWLGLIGATALDITPRFAIPEKFTTSDVVDEDLQPAMRTLLLSVRLVFPWLSPIAQALRMMSSVAKTVNANSFNQDFWRDAVGAVVLLGPVTHYLLSLQRPTGPISEASRAVIVSELARLTCLIFLSRLKALFTLNALDIERLSLKILSSAAQSTNDDGENDILTDVKLWAVVSSALLLPCNQARALLPYIRATARAKGISEVSSAVDLAKRLIWIETLEEPRVNGLMDEFNAITSQSSDTD